MQGWIKLFRMILDNPIVTKDSDYFAVWIYLLLLATHQEKDVLFKGKRITLKKGQLITGRKEIAKKFKIDESKVQRILKSFENEHQIEQQSGNRNRLVTIVSWEDYQQIEQQNEQQVNNNCTTDEQQVNTNKNVKNIKNDKNVKKEEVKPAKRFVPPTLDEVQAYCSERNNNVDAERFIDHYTANGWLVGGKSKMKDWKASVRTWEKRSFDKETQSQKPATDSFMAQLASMRE